MITRTKKRHGVLKNRRIRKNESRIRTASASAPKETKAVAEIVVPEPEWTAQIPDTAPKSDQEPAEKPLRGPWDSNTALNLYLQEIGTEALLTPEDETELAGLIAEGDEAARERMIRANLRLVVKIAHDFEGMGLPLMDLINEGNIGLMKAVDRFDPEKGAKFSTYGAFWIKQAMRRSLSNHSKLIRLPVHLVDKLGKMRRAETRLQDILGRVPTEEEMADELDIPIKRLQVMRRASRSPISLEEPIREDDSACVQDRIADERAEDPFEEFEKKTSVALLNDVLPILNDREATILRYRFGLDGEDTKTLEEIGDEFGVTRERIRQIQSAALVKLRKQMEKRKTDKWKN